MPDHAMVDTAKPGKHSFTVSATDKAGNRTTKTVHYMVLSAGKLTISGPVKAFRRNGKWWIDTGIRAACPGTGPACAAVLHSHRQLAAARVGRANVSIAGGKSRELEFELGPGRLAALDQGGTIQVKIDAKLSRGTSHLVRLTRPADVKPTP